MVVVIGVGGVGEPIARRMARADVAGLVLVDPVDKSTIADRLSAETAVQYREALSNVVLDEIHGGVVVINAAGREGALEDSGLYEWLEKITDKAGVFVDLRPHLRIKAVERARSLGWQGYTGHGMNVRNDYVLLEGITVVMGVSLPSFEEFKQLVAAAS